MTDATATTSSQFNDVTPVIVSPRIVYVIREMAQLAPLCHTIDMGSTPGITTNIPTVSTTLSMSSVSTGADETEVTAATSMSSGVVAVTAAAKAVYVLLSKFLNVASAVPMDAAIEFEIGRALVADIEASIAALLAGGSNTAGTTGVALDIGTIHEAIATYRTNALELAERGVGVLHPVSVGQLNKSALTGGQGLSPLMSRQDVIDIYGAEPGSGLVSNVLGKIGGIPFMQSTRVPLANANADRAGAIITRVDAQNSNMCSFALNMKVPPNQMQADGAVNQRLMTVKQGWEAYGVAEIIDASLVTIISSAT